jgi:hypothetical protein
MINIFYVPGTFGSTVEYVVRSHTEEYSLEISAPLDSGSMHGFRKLAHLRSLQEIKNYLENCKNPNAILNIGYPFLNHRLDDIVDTVKNYSTAKDRNIVIYCNNVKFAEQNLLFQYHKISVPNNDIFGIKLFTNPSLTDFKKWNPDYTTWYDLQPWEFREWFSIFYPALISECMHIPMLIDDTFLFIPGNDILHNTVSTLLKILDFCNLTINKDLIPFVEEWQSKQQYILREYKMLSTIVEYTIKNQPYTWSNLNIIAEAIIQNQLRQHGYELKCNDLNEFPTNSLELHKLLEPTWRTA